MAESAVGRNSAMSLQRRAVLALLGGSAITGALRPVFALAATGVAPLTLPLHLEVLCGHIGVSVRDVAASALFYSRLFGGDNVTGEKLPFLRYMINLGGGENLGEGGGVAIGKLGTLGSQGKTSPLIDHFCLNARSFDEAAWRTRLKLEGLAYIAQGVFIDPDGIAIQIAGGQGGENLAAGAIETMAPLFTGEPLLRPLGFEHIMVQVSNLRRSMAFYERLFGLSPQSTKYGLTYFSDGKTRLGLQQAAAGAVPAIHHYAVKVKAFDKVQLRRQLVALGATVLPHTDGSRHSLRLADPEGLVVELWPT
jgi:catechol 2,3-dioxygenase-like lactoylglutathione lyase family enzyme